MSYRGEDLDLRTPAGRSQRDPYAADATQNGQRPRSLNGGSRTEPTYVDDTVLACCNHAYDIAQAHSAADVRLEHLIHAMTRVEAAAQVLEDRGVREAHLRRESAAILTSQIPVGLANAHGSPRASGELDDVLRRAQDIAARNGVVAGVEEVLWVMLSSYRDHPAVQLLARHAPDWQQWEWNWRAEPRDTRRPAARSSMQTYYPERTYQDAPPRQRLEPMPVAQPVGYAPAAFDTHRIESIEGAVRAMQSDMASERRALSDLVREMQRELRASRNDPGLGDIIRDLQRELKSSRPDLGLIERVEGIERALESRLQDLTRTASALADRLQGLERSITIVVQDNQKGFAGIGERLKVVDQLAQGSSGELADLVTEQLVALSDRLGQIERTVASAQPGAATLQTVLNDRFQTLRQTVDQQNLVLTSAIAQLTEPVNERMRLVEQGIARSQTEGKEVWRALADRLGQIESTVRTQGDGLVQQSQRDKGELAEAIIKLGTNQQVLADNLEAWRADQAGNVSIIANHIDRLEQGLYEPMRLVEGMSADVRLLQTDMQGIQQVTLADYDRNRRGFRHWLFGTEDVFAHSWTDETRQVRERLKQLAGQRKETA
jgi:hypothetical protein